MKERVLHLDVGEAVEFFAGTKYKFFELTPYGNELGVKIEVPKSSNEVMVIDIPSTKTLSATEICEKLRKAGFIQQTLRVTAEW